MSYDLDDTIAAIATARGGAARSIIRISGPAAILIARRCFESDDAASLEGSGQATAMSGRVSVWLGDAVEAGSCIRAEQWVPCELLLWPTCRSYTRQPVAELHTFASPPIVDAVLAKVCVAGARLAAPGEFTLRAFLAGRIDLTQAEAVLGVIDSRGDDELHASLAQLAGGLARPLNQLRDDLLQLLAELEAGLDFVEEDIQFIASTDVIDRLRAADRLLGDVADQMTSRSTSRDFDEVALLGPPNAGKSSLFNALVARFGITNSHAESRHHAALVSSERGTTRDYLTATIELDGVRCELVDTAGQDDQSKIRMEADSASTIDAKAQQLSAQRRSRAALRVLCSDVPVNSEVSTEIDAIALTKADVLQHSHRQAAVSPGAVPIVITSSRSGAGLDELGRVLQELLTRETTAQTGRFVAATAERCRESVRLAAAALRRAEGVVLDGSGDELAAVEIRLALSELGKVVGAIYTDDLLDRIFSRFCIGK